MVITSVPSDIKKRVLVSSKLISNGADACSDDLPPPTGKAKRRSKTLRRLQVQVVHRHGDRSPITSLKDEEYWTSQLIPESTLQKIASNTTLVDNGEKNTHKANGRGPFGKLTMLGLQQMIDLGTTLRQELSCKKTGESCITEEDGDTTTIIYPHIWTSERPLDPANIRVISTSFVRAIQSVQGVLAGLFPDGFSETIEIDTRETMNMIPDPQPRHTKEQAELEDKLADRPHLQEREDEMLPLAIRVTKALHPLLAEDAREASFGAKQALRSSTESIEIEPLAWNQLGEITKCLTCRNMLPAPLTHSDHEAVVQHAAWRWFETFRHPRVAYLGMSKMCTKMVNSAVDWKNQPPMTLYSAHDSTLIGLLCAFKLEQPVSWPEYGSFFMMELLEVNEEDNESTKGELFIRFSMNGELLHSRWEERPVNMILLQTLAEKLRREGEATAEYDDLELTGFSAA